MHIDMEAPRGWNLGIYERQEIALGIAEGLSAAAIGRQIGRPTSTVTREIARNQDSDGQYRFLQAEQLARSRAHRVKPSKLAQPGPLRDYVTTGLSQKYSPEQIAQRLRLDYPTNPEMHVCHETIYQGMYVESRGGLKREVEHALRQGRAYRHPRRKPEHRRKRIPGMIPIAERPDDVETRQVPGHWEGDLIIGKNSASAVATLVERRARYTMLGHLDTDHTAASVRDAIVPLLTGLPSQLRRTLTWDQGSEMACHFEVATHADIEVYFADPHSPWQRGTNENTNGLLRQYMPKGTDLSTYTAHDLETIANELNNRPRKVLGWLTPTEAMHLILGHTVIIGGQPAHLPDNLLPLAQRCIDP
jgi:IS30 family transposase